MTKLKDMPSTWLKGKSLYYEINAGMLFRNTVLFEHPDNPDHDFDEELFPLYWDFRESLQGITMWIRRESGEWWNTIDTPGGLAAVLAEAEES